MTIFKTRGFDSLIAKGLTVRGELLLEVNSTLIIEGAVFASAVRVANPESVKSNKTTLRVTGELGQMGDKLLDIEIQNVIITGKVECNELRVEGTLAVKSGASLVANKILYRELVVETGAIMNGAMYHLDHVSEGEKT